MIIGILHPGAMGAVLGGAAEGEVHWASEGRSAATGERAAAHGLTDAGSVAALAATADVLISVCPPHAALDVAAQVQAAGFDGLYVEANAVSPAVAAAIGERFDRFVDAAVVGPPPVAPGTTRLYLCGEEAGMVAALWRGSAAEPVVLDGPPGHASALKMAYAGWTKGSAALLLAIRAYAARAGVAEALAAEWARSIPGLTERAERTATGTAPKAWRFAGEMEQIADSLAAAGLPDGFHRSAQEIYRRMAALRSIEAPALDEVVERLLDHGDAIEPA